MLSQNQLTWVWVYPQSELEKHGNEPVWLTRTGPDAPIPGYINDPVGVLRGMQANALQVGTSFLCQGQTWGC